MTDLEALHAHQQEHHRIVTQALRYIAKGADLPYPLVRDDFISGDPEVTGIVWDIIHETHPGRFHGVSWCHACRSFALYEKTH